MTDRVAERCPICGKPAAPPARPFCSPRCADVDLQRWLSDRYVVSDPTDDDADDASGQPGDAPL